MLKSSAVFDYHQQQPHFPSPSSSDRRAAASTAFITAPRIPPASSACTAAMVVPPGLVTWSFSAPGCSPVSCAHTHGFQAATSTSLADAFHKLCGIRTHQPSRLRFEVDQDEPGPACASGVVCISLTHQHHLCGAEDRLRGECRRDASWQPRPHPTVRQRLDELEDVGGARARQTCGRKQRDG